MPSNCRCFDDPGEKDAAFPTPGWCTLRHPPPIRAPAFPIGAIGGART